MLSSHYGSIPDQSSNPNWTTSAHHWFKPRYYASTALSTAPQNNRCPMRTIVITLENGKITTDGGTDVSTSQSMAPTTDSHNINRHLDPDTVVDLIEQTPEDEICARQSTKYPNWSRGDPCPVCENIELAIMELREATYTSSISPITR